MNSFKDIDKSYNNYHTTLQSVNLILQFVHHIIQLKNEDFIILYPTIITQILHWTEFPDLHEQAMSILQTIIINVRCYNSFMDQDLQCVIYEKLAESLDVSLNL